MIKKIFLVLLLFVCILAIYYFQPTTQDQAVPIIDNAEIEEHSTNINILGHVDEGYLKIIHKIKRGESLTREEQEQIDQQRIQNLEKIDKKAADLERELQIKGYLAEEDYDYLSAKRKELDRLVAIELIKENKKNIHPKELKKEPE